MCIVDFEFSGKDGGVRYPFSINEDLFSRFRVKGGDLITHEIDGKMAHKLFQ